MVASPQDQSVLGRISRLEQSVKNLTTRVGTFGTKTFFAPGGEICSQDGTVMLEADPGGVGWSRPWLQIPVMQSNTGPTGSTSTSSYPSGAWVAPQQINTSVSGTVNYNNMLFAFIPYVSHPHLLIRDFSSFQSPLTSVTWGLSVYGGSNFNSTPLANDYWTQSTAGGTYESHEWDISAFIGRTDIGIALWCSAVTPAATNGFIILQPFGVYLKGTD